MQIGRAKFFLRKESFLYFYYFYLSMLRYLLVIYHSCYDWQSKLYKHNKPLRWLLRWGSPLTFPNREVKPNCADGTAVMWESMSPPSFIKRLSEKIASFFCYILVLLGLFLFIAVCVLWKSCVSGWSGISRFYREYSATHDLVVVINLIGIGYFWNEGTPRKNIKLDVALRINEIGAKKSTFIWKCFCIKYRRNLYQCNCSKK